MSQGVTTSLRGLTREELNKAVAEGDADSAFHALYRH